MKDLTLDTGNFKACFKWNGTAWSELIWLRIVVVVAGSCEGASEFLGSLECGESFEKRELPFLYTRVNKIPSA